MGGEFPNPANQASEIAISVQTKEIDSPPPKAQRNHRGFNMYVLRGMQHSEDPGGRSAADFHIPSEKK